MSLTAATIAPATRGVVTGHLIACDALGLTHPAYADGMVSVLRGEIRLAYSDKDNAVVEALPTEVVARQSVSADNGYTFILDPGRYVLATPGPWISTAITLNPGDHLRVDMPNGCI
ncbi:MAG TPA: hypothetical protein VGG31_01120 [Candidatus Dormibacteraeota bacterium]